MIVIVCLALAMAGWAVYAVGTMSLAEPPRRGVTQAGVAAGSCALCWLLALGYGLYAGT